MFTDLELIIQLTIDFFEKQNIVARLLIDILIIILKQWLIANLLF